MKNTQDIVSEFLKEFNLINNIDFIKNPNNKFSLKFSLLVESVLINVLENISNGNTNILVIALGSFGRRELSPKSDIEILFANISDEQYLNIKNSLNNLALKINLNFKLYKFEKDYDYLNENFTFFCKLFQSRLIFGNSNDFKNFYEQISANLKDNIVHIYDKFIQKYNSRIEFYGKFPNTIEPNIKYSAGGLRDLHEAEWIYSILNNKELMYQNEIMQTSLFINELIQNNGLPRDFLESVYKSYNLLLTVRNLLHYINNKKIDRLEFKDQDKIYSALLNSKDEEFNFGSVHDFMKMYFVAANQINLFYNLFLVYFKDRISPSLPEALKIIIDDDFYQIGDTIFSNTEDRFSLSDVLRLFFYRAKYGLYIDDKLKFKIVNDLKQINFSETLISESSTFFRELFELDNISNTLILMYELGIFDYIIPEFIELSGYYENTINHLYTFDIHSIYAINVLENLYHTDNELKNLLYTLTSAERAQLHLALILHDIAKPIIKAGNEMLAAEMAHTILSRLGYEDKEITIIAKLIRNKRKMSNLAFSDKFYDINELNELAELVSNQKFLTQLYLLTYANLSAQSKLIYTPWKAERLNSLFYKVIDIINSNNNLELQLSPAFNEISSEIQKYIPEISDSNIHNFLTSIRDNRYFSSFDSKEIARQIKYFSEENTQLAIEITEKSDFFEIIIIGKYNKFVFPSVCGLLFLQNLNILESILIKTRKDNLIAKVIVEYPKNNKKFNISNLKNTLEADLLNVVNGIVDIENLILEHQSYLKKLEKKLFKKKTILDIYLNQNQQYNTLEIKAVDKKGFLYKISSAIVNCGLDIYYSKTKTADNKVECRLFILTEDGKKISSVNFPYIQESIIKAYNEL